MRCPVTCLFPSGASQGVAAACEGVRGWIEDKIGDSRDASVIPSVWVGVSLVVGWPLHIGGVVALLGRSAMPCGGCAGCSWARSGWVADCRDAMPNGMPNGAIVQDLRLCPLLNFSHFGAPLFSQCFHTIMNFGHFWAALSCVSIVSCSPTRPGRRGSHTTARQPYVHISGPRRFKHHKNSTEGPQERKKKENCGGRREKKSAKFWAPHPSGPHFFQVWGNPSGLHPLRPTLGGPKVQHPKIGRNRFFVGKDQNHKERMWPGMFTLLNHQNGSPSGHARILFGQTVFGQNRIWPILVFFCFGQICCCCFFSWLLLLFLVVVVVVGCCLLVVLVGGACWWCLLVFVGGACWWCLLVVLVGGACWWCLLVVFVGAFGGCWFGCVFGGCVFSPG